PAPAASSARRSRARSASASGPGRGPWTRAPRRRAGPGTRRARSRARGPPSSSAPAPAPRRSPLSRPRPSVSAEPARVAGVRGELGEALDLALALDPRGVVRREALDQAPDAVADLKREVGGRGPGEGANVVDRDLPRPGDAVWSLGFAHLVAPPARRGLADLTGATSASESISACSAAEMALSSPITQTWL